MFAREIRLTRGQALVLVHPDIDLSSQVARGIAEAYGSFEEATAAAVLDGGIGSFTMWMRKQLQTLVLHGAPSTQPGVNRTKAVISQHSLVLAAGQSQVAVKPPNFIFCTGNADWLPGDVDQRRYRVVDVAQLEGADMKALSIRQPWAWLIVNGHKPVENRTWPTPHRGDLLIHAGLQFDEAGLASVLSVFPQLRSVLPQRYDLGGVVGTTQLVACVQDHPSRWFTGPYGFVMYESRPIPFVPLRGALSFFEVPMSTALHAALHATNAQQAEAAGQASLL